MRKEKAEPTKELIEASKEIGKVLEKYPGLAYHVLLVEKEGDACSSLLEGSQSDLYRGIFHTAFRLEMYRDILGEAVNRLWKMEHPTEEDLADTMIDSWLQLHSEEEGDATDD